MVRHRLVLAIQLVLIVSSCSTSPASPDAAALPDASGSSDTGASADGSVVSGDLGPAADAGPPGACTGMDPQCDGTTGLCRPSPVCTVAAPCMNALVGLERRTLTEPLTTPVCRTTRTDHPMFDDGAPRTWMIDGVQRAACVYAPPTAVAATPRPLVVYLHGAGGTASGIYDLTLLRQKAVDTDLAGDGVRGFVLASHQGRNQVNENGNPPASRHDVYYRRLDGADANADVRSLDTLIDDLVRTGTVDRRRIYLTGWSNGAFFSQGYALRRWSAPTPGGNRIAAVAVFDGGDPFQSPRADLPGCDLLTVPRVPLPVMIVHRACSIVGCNAAQATALGLDPGFDVTAWVERLRTEIGATVVDRVVAGNGMVGTCAAQCGMANALIQHVQWPDGISDRSGIDHEPAMLDFLKMHALP